MLSNVYYILWFVLDKKTQQNGESHCRHKLHTYLYCGSDNIIHIQTIICTYIDYLQFQKIWHGVQKTNLVITVANLQNGYQNVKFARTRFRFVNNIIHEFWDCSLCAYINMIYCIFQNSEVRACCRCGGLWCGGCALRLISCPWCRAPSPKGPNLPLIRLLYQLKLPCRNKR